MNKFSLGILNHEVMGRKYEYAFQVPVPSSSFVFGNEAGNCVSAMTWKERLSQSSTERATMLAVSPFFEYLLNRSQGDLTIRLTQVFIRHGCFGGTCI